MTFGALIGADVAAGTVTLTVAGGMVGSWIRSTDSRTEDTWGATFPISSEIRERSWPRFVKTCTSSATTAAPSA